MHLLENRIPPPVVLAISLALMWYLARFDPQSSQDTLESLVTHFSVRSAFGLCIATFGIAVTVAGVLSFRHEDTTVNPLRPEQASQLVVRGVYRYTRNPMYLGMAFVALSWAVVLGSWLSLIGVLAFVIYITQLQIVPEERAMQRLFGAEFDRYRAQTRRWI